MSILLAIDCTQSPINIAVGWDGAVHSHAVGPVQRDSAANLFEVIDHALTQARKQKADIQNVLAITGPGSFTGIRVGISFAQSFSFAQNIPVYGLTAFQVLSSSRASAGIQDGHGSPALGAEDDKTLIIIESKRAELYAQFYQAGMPLAEPFMATAEELLALSMVESAALYAPFHLKETFGHLLQADFYDATELGKLALQAFWQHQPAPAPLAPFYLRPPDAVPAPVR